jgi:opacity protein-like surface antigen
MVTLYDDYALYSVEDGNDKDIDSGYGITGKVSYAMSNLLTPYVQVKYTTDGFIAYGDMDDFTVDDGMQTGGLTEVIAGADYKLTDKLTLNGEAKLQSAGEKVFKDANGEKEYDDEGKDSAFKVSVGATFKF